MRTADLDFELPPELIAQAPPSDRSSARLLQYQRTDGRITHRTFAELPRLLRSGDLLVFNNAQVLPARFMLQKATGGLIEGLFLSETAAGRWRVLLKGIGRYRGPLHFYADASISVTIVHSLDAGEHEITVSGGMSAALLLQKLGRMPLPPYIRRDKVQDDRDNLDRSDYQTVYASAGGSVAAPTAGLHFTQALLQELQSAGVEQAYITLHVGMGTFKPVTADQLEDHPMHRERYEIDSVAAEKLNRARTEKRRIVAVGTTSARVLESWGDRPFESATGETGIFILPGYHWSNVGALITNFHLPRSTLIALIAALVGLDEQRRIYQTAIAEKYQFFSFGDAMLIE